MLLVHAQHQSHDIGRNEWLSADGRVSKEVMAAVCESCLSSGRLLSRVQPALRRLLAAVLSDAEQDFIYDKIANMNICWECAAVLNRVWQFKLRTARAQQWLEWARKQRDNDLMKNVMSLSSLKIEKYTVLKIIPSMPTCEEHADENGSKNMDPESYEVKVKLEPSLDDFGGEYVAEDLPHVEKQSSFENKSVEGDLKVFDFDIKIRSEQDQFKSPSAKKRNSKKKEVKKSKRKGMQYGYMYDKLKISSKELQKMREEEQREPSFVGAPLKCETCITAFRCETMLKKHNSIQHSKKLTNTCAVCSKRFGTKEDQERHQRGHYFCYKCKKCGLLFLERDAACRHYKKDQHNHGSDTSFATSEDVQNAAEYIKHPSIHKDYCCHICNKLFTFKGNFTKHMQTHTQKQRPECDICNKSFSKKHLKEHMLTHTVDKSHQCNICNKRFTLKGYLKQHMLLHTVEPQHQCEICSKCFRQRGNLKQHMLSHKGEKSYWCPICSKGFTMKLGLKRHMLYHTGQLPFRCDICTKGFPIKSNLEQHMIIHTGEKPYQCKVCSKRYPLKATLKQHMILHSFDPRNQCDVCKKCFTQAKSLRLHSMIHTGERPYVCEICSKRYTYEQSLQRHMFTHTGEQPHECEICCKRFAMKSNLKLHLRKVHKVDRPPQFSLPVSRVD